MKKSKDPDMLPEYGFRGGVRGKYFGKVDFGSVTVIRDGQPTQPRKRAVAAKARNGKKRKRA